MAAKSIPLIAAENFYRAVAARPGIEVSLEGVPESEWAAAIFAPHLVGTAQLDGYPPLTPRIETNRWIVDCPFCPSAQAASKNDPWFLCPECGNSAVGAMKVPIAWPDGWELVEEAMLERQPVERHWVPASQSVAEIAEENLAAGLPAPLIPDELKQPPDLEQP